MPVVYRGKHIPMKQLWSVYCALTSVSVQLMLQYRLTNLFWLLGMLFEPCISLVIWSTVATQNGGAVAGYTTASLTGYYIAWTLVRQWNIALTPFGFEQRVRQGQLSPLLLRPLHPFHYDLADFIALRIVGTLYWLPIGVVMVVWLKPDLSHDPLTILLFCVSLVFSFLMRFVFVYALGMIVFWTTRVSAVFNLYFALETILSGRLVPQALLPTWAQQLAVWLPFRWSFGFPIEIIIGKLSIPQILQGMGIQVLWGIIATVAFMVLWHAGIKRYSAVGA